MRSGRASRACRLALGGLITAVVTGAHAQSFWVVGGTGGASWGSAVERWIALDDTARAGAVQPRAVPEDWSVMREVVRSGIQSAQRNLFGYRWALTKGPRLLEADTLDVGWHPRLWQAGGENASATAVMRGLVDGDELAAGFTHAERKDGLRNAETFFTLDLGVPVPIDSVVFFPPQSGLTSDNERQRELFATNYEVSRSNTPVEWLIFENEDLSTGSVGYHPLDEILGSTFSNNTSVVSLTSDLRFTRFLRFRFGGETRTVLVAEVEAFGRGYPQEARYLSRPHSFGERVSLGAVTWHFTKYRQAARGEIVEDPAAPVELSLRTRAGSDDDAMAYYLFDDLGRELRVERTDYYNAPPVTEAVLEGVAGFRGRRTDDVDNWSNWSVPYERSGTQIRSSDGNEFLQFRFEITTQDPLTFGVLDSVAFEVSPLLADSAVAEISLDGVVANGRVEVPMGVDTAFVYDIRTVAGGPGWAGYDVIELDLPSGARFVSLEIDDAPASPGVDYELLEEPGRLTLAFSEPVRRDASMRVRFRGAIFQASVFLEGRIVNREAARLPQSIEGGDARSDVTSDGVQMIASDTRFPVLRRIDLSSAVMTPNGDGRTDETVVLFDLFGVEGGEIVVRVDDLSGRSVRRILAGRALSGPYGLTWDGRTDDGELVPPGLYVVRVEVEVDEGRHVRIRPVAVAY